MEELALRALRAYHALVRIARHPEQDPAWPMIMIDLVEAELHASDLDPATAVEVRAVLDSIRKG